MGRPRIGTELKKPSDYSYDYPENREISKWMEPNDAIIIASRTGYTTSYIYYWFAGKRRNALIEEWARYIMRLNKAKQKKLQKLSI